MALTPNSTFGNYRIGDVIGEGGMGQVYRATDTTLDREVAIKVLPESFATDADRVARFEREAKTLASLNHPNIGMIFGLERLEGVIAIVMELVDGPTLADRIAEGPLPADEALRIARQLIEGLEAAHARGIVHRDLKPANIKVKHDGHVKILDFGIARPIDFQGASGGKTPTMVTPAVTETGIIMGTAAYMSPEQARGRFVDERTDIWAFGCVLYEMLTGQPAFGGEDVAETLARIITQDADTNSLPGMISPMVRHTIQMCLQKDVKQRIADIRDVRLAIAGDFETGALPAGGGAVTKRSPVLAGGLSLVIVILLSVIGVGMFLEAGPEPLPVHRYSVNVPGDLNLGDPPRFEMSPDGRYMVFSGAANGGENQLWLWSLESLEPTPLQGTQDADGGFWSPDSQQIAFVQNGSLKRLPINGGPVQTVMSSGVNRGFTLAWSNTGMLLYTMAGGSLSRVAANGGEPVQVTQQVENDAFAHDELPFFLPDGNHFLYFRHASDGGVTGIYLGSIDLAPEQQDYNRLIRATDGGIYVPGPDGEAGLIVFGLETNLYAQRFDPVTGELDGDALPLEEKLSNPGGGFGQYTLSGDGKLLIMRKGTSSGYTNIVSMLGPSGEKEPLGTREAGITEVAVSPDNTQVALTIYDNNAGGSLSPKVWIWSRSRQNLRLLTTEEGRHVFPRWSRDGVYVYYENQGRGIYRRRADGTGTQELMHEFNGNTFFDVGADKLLFTMSGVDGTADIFQKGFIPDAPAEPLIATSQNEFRAVLSPDGKWLAYVSNQSGQQQIYVRPFPEVESGLWLVSGDNEADYPEWNDSGNALFYVDRANRALMRVPVDTDPVFSPGTPVVIQNLTDYLLPADIGAQAIYMYDWGDDEQTLFLIDPIVGAESEDKNRVLVIENRFQEIFAEMSNR